MKKVKEGRKAYSRHKAKQKIELRRTLKIIIVLIIITQYSTYLSAISINISATEGYDKAERTGAKDKGRLNYEKENERKNLELNNKDINSPSSNKERTGRIHATVEKEKLWWLCASAGRYR